MTDIQNRRLTSIWADQPTWTAERETGSLMPEPAAASIAISHLISGPTRRAVLLGTFPKAIYLSVADTVVGVVSPDGIRLPNALVASPPLIDWNTIGTSTPTLGNGTLTLGSRRFFIARWWDPRPRIPSVNRARLAASLNELEWELGPWPPSELGRRTAVFGNVLRWKDSKRIADAAMQLVGVGPGLTPGGDDVLCGFLSALRLIGGPSVLRFVDDIAKAVLPTVAHRTTKLSIALLRHAARGQVAQPIASVLLALAGSQPLGKPVRQLLGIGHTSGRDLTAGIILAGRLITSSDR